MLDFILMFITNSRFYEGNHSLRRIGKCQFSLLMHDTKIHKYKDRKKYFFSVRVMKIKYSNGQLYICRVCLLSGEIITMSQTGLIFLKAEFYFAACFWFVYLVIFLNLFIYVLIEKNLSDFEVNLTNDIFPRTYCCWNRFSPCDFKLEKLAFQTISVKHKNQQPMDRLSNLTFQPSFSIWIPFSAISFK